MKSFSKLCIPIALETLCHMLAGMMDTIMLSSVGDNAVGGGIGAGKCHHDRMEDWQGGL